MQLVLNSYGCSLSRHKGRFRVQADEEVKLISPHRVQSILLPSAASLTTGAILLALKHEIPLIIMDASGKPMGRLWQVGFGSTAKIRRAQLQIANHNKASEWFISHLRKKIHFQTRLLEHLGKQKASALKLSRSCIQFIRKQEAKLPPFLGHPISKIASSIRGLEGSMSRQYFRTLNLMLPKRYSFASRSRRPGKDAFNTSLNYVYGMLYGKVETQLIAAGLDPYLPLFHADGYNKAAFVFDFIEAYRPWADQVVMEQCQSHNLKKKHFETKAQGLWLNKAGRAEIIPAFWKMMEEAVDREGQHVKKEEFILRDAHSFAQMLLSA